MSLEGQVHDCKSLRSIEGQTADWNEIAKDCVAFANAHGGNLLIGIEDGKTVPPAQQRISDEQIERVRRRIGEVTVNTAVAVERKTSGETGGEYIHVTVSRSHSPASTTDGRYYLRIADESKPLVGEQIQRLLNERNAQPWETLTTLNVPRNRIDLEKLATFTKTIRASDRVKPSVKEKSDAELMDHYYLAIGDHLTNLGILCIGQRNDRFRLGTAPVIQYIKYDHGERKVNKRTWDEHSLSPMELVEMVWQEVPDFHESYELPDGLFRQNLPAYDQRVIRELLVNALVHRPYTQRGDIYLNLHPERLQIVNPGQLPLGVTPQNILHQSVRRNEGLARIFHDMGMMEREGSGYDLLYEILTSQGRKLPEVQEGPDRVAVLVDRRVMNPIVIDFLAKANAAFQLTQRERIALGILVQHDALSMRQLAEILELQDTSSVAGWLGRLLDWGVIKQVGRTRGSRYFVDPELLDKMDFPSKTTLARIETHRLQALILEDLQRHPQSAISEIRERIGEEIPLHQIRRQLIELNTEEKVVFEGEKRWRRYRLA